MAKQVRDIDTLKTYIAGVVERAGHHAPGVEDIVLALAGAVVWRKDPTTPLKVNTRDGQMTNVLWVEIGGKRYAFSYNHDQQTVEVRAQTLQGAVMRSFSNSTPVNEVKAFFGGL